jgi:type IV pilus assembly protein PilC
MPRFAYAARDDGGKAIAGEIVAPSRTDAARLLRQEGKFVVRLEQAREASTEGRQRPTGRGRRRVTEEQVIYFASQLAVMVETGVPLAEALAAAIEDEPPGAYRDVIEDVLGRVQAGAEFSASLERHGRVFPRFFSNIVRASEASGLLGTMLQRAARHMRQQRETRRRIQGAMAYPAVMVVFCLLVSTFMIAYILPKFAVIFRQRGSALPVPTQILLAVGTFLAEHLVWLGPLAVACGAGLWYFFRTPSGYRTASWLKIRTWLIGPMYRRAYLTRAARTLGTLVDSGVAMMDAVQITRNVVGNHYYELLFDHVGRQLQKGLLLSDALKGSPLLPHSIVQMILAGERTGQLGTVLERVADYCDQELEHVVLTVTRVIEPALVIFIGTFIGSIAISLLLPIFSISRVAAG